MYMHVILASGSEDFSLLCCLVQAYYWPRAVRTSHCCVVLFRHVIGLRQ